MDDLFRQSTTMTQFSTAREISETFTMKLYGMKWCFFSLIINSLLLYLQVRMGEGIVMPFAVGLLNTVGTVVIEILLLFANIVTFQALNSGSAALFGSWIANANGYSLAVCGFQQTSAIKKSSFCSNLSLNSTCRKLLGRISIIWIVLEVRLFFEIRDQSYPAAYETSHPDRFYRYAQGIQSC